MAEGVKTKSLHDQAIDGLIAGHPLMRRNGFWQAHRELWHELIKEYEEFYDPEEYPDFHFLPDAYVIDREAKRLVFFEVEDRNPLTREKRRQYGDFWFAWDSMDFGDWEVRLYIVNRFGAVTHRLHMSDLLIEGLLQDSHDKRIAQQA